MNVTVNADPSSAPQVVSPLVPFATPGIYRPQTGTFFLRGSQTSGAADVATFNFGTPGSVPIVGDWNGDGVDTIGVFEPVTASWFLRNSNSAGAVDVGPFSFGGSGWKPVVGDWDGEFTDTVGVWNPVTAEYHLRNTNTPGAADVTPFTYGGNGLVPLVCHWTPSSATTVIPVPNAPGPSIPASGLGGVTPLSWRQIDVNGGHLIPTAEMFVGALLLGSPTGVASYESMAEEATTLPAERFFSAVALQAFEQSGAFAAMDSHHHVHDLSGPESSDHLDEEFDVDEVAALTSSLNESGQAFDRATDEILQRFFW